MVTFKAKIERFARKGEKTGWSYIEISEKLSEKIKPGVKKSYRIRGALDSFKIQKTAILPMGDGKFILPFNATMRKGTGKTAGDAIRVSLEADDSVLTLNADLLACIKDDAKAYKFFKSLPKGHQSYFSKWIDSAKTESTKTKRITMAIVALSQEQGYGEMIRANKKLSVE